MGICTSKANQNEYGKRDTEKRSNFPHLGEIGDNSDYDIGKCVTAAHISNPLMQSKFKRPHTVTRIHSDITYKDKQQKADIDIINNIKYDSKRLVIAYMNDMNNNNKMIAGPIYELVFQYYNIKYKFYAIPHNNSENSCINLRFQRLKAVEEKIKCIENIYSLNRQYIIRSGNKMYNLSLLNCNDKSNYYKTHFEQTPNIELVAVSKNQTFIKFCNKSIYTTEKVYSSFNKCCDRDNKTINIFNKHLFYLSSLYYNKQKENITSIECGRQHTLFLSHNGRVYSMGNNDKGQCGLGEAMVNTFITQPTLIETFIKENCKIKSISCSEQSSCCVDDTASHQYLWCWGHTIAYSKGFVYGTNGYMSQPNISVLSSSSSMTNNENINVIKATCNGNTTVAMDEMGYCYVLGGMMCGKSTNRLNDLNHANTNIKFKDFDIGFDHILLISRDEKIYKLMYNNGAYNLYKLQVNLFPNLKSDCVVHSVVIASDSTIIIFY